MKLYKNILLVAVMVLSIVSCKDNSEPEVKIVAMETSLDDNTSKQFDANATYAKVEFNIKGMTCAMGCAKTIEKKMAKMEGVKMAKVDFDKELAMVEYDDAKVTPTSLNEVIAKVSESYEVKDLKIVDSFSSEKNSDTSIENHICKADCKMACCKDKKAGEKVVCAADCKKDCCKNKKA